VRGASGGADAWAVLWRPSTVELVGRTLLLVAAVTVAATVLGVALAWLVVATDLPGRGLWGVAAALPLVVPSYVTALALIAALGPGGLLQAAWLFGFPGAFAALTLATYP
jgi:iron(III) transport system permease protein